MRIIFPQKWDQQFINRETADLCMTEWSQGINGLSNQQLAIGVNRVREECEWPPSIAEFIKLCCEPEEPEEHWEHKRYANQKNNGQLALPIIIDKKNGREALKKLKQKCGIRK